VDDFHCRWTAGDFSTIPPIIFPIRRLAFKISESAFLFMLTGPTAKEEAGFEALEKLFVWHHSLLGIIPCSQR